MLKIACLSQKGGVGKSTIARLIARTYAAAEWRVKIADFNIKQTTSVDWARIRLQFNIDPQLAAEGFGQSGLPHALKQETNYELMVFDGKPDADQLTLDIARLADVIVVPTGVSQDDLLPQIRFVNELKAKKIDADRIMIVINNVPDTAGNWTAAARKYLEQVGFQVARTEIPQKTAYQSAQNGGRAISETNFQTLNDKAEALAQEVIDKVEAVQKALKVSA